MRLGALGAAAALTAMSIAPAMGAEVVSQASASAITIGIAGNGTDSGRVTATNDGSGETKEGQVDPPISVLQPQGLLNLGVLAQDAAAQVQDGDGVSAACSGVAGNGGAVGEIGDSNCIFPGDQPVGVDVGNLDLSDTVVINPQSALGGLSEPVQLILGPILEGVTPQLQAALEPLASTGLNGSFGAVEARCTATPGAATGEANLTDAQLRLTIGDQSVVLATLEQNPAPNTEVLVSLDEVLNPIIEDIEQTLRDSLEGALAPIADQVLPEIREQVITNIVGQISDQLGPLQDNILSLTLNKQTSTGPGHIDVTALDLQVLPAAAEFLDASLVSLQLANVTCGPNSTLAPQPGGPGPVEENPDEELPLIPTVVDSGTTGGANSPAFVAGLLMLMGAAAMVGYRRLLPAGK